jgi:hypothetical protein
METLAHGDSVTSQDLKRLHNQSVCGYSEENAVECWSHPRVAQELEHTIPLIMVLRLWNGRGVAPTGIEDDGV